MADIIARAETALAGIRDGQWVIAGAEELEAVTRELVDQLKSERRQLERQIVLRAEDQSMIHALGGNRERVAVVEMPPLMEDRSVVAESIREQPMWARNDAWAAVNDEDRIEFEADGQNIYGTLATARDARDLAAVLLAAADAVEQAEADADG